MKKFAKIKVLMAWILSLGMLLGMIPSGVYATANTSNLEASVIYYQNNKSTLNSWWELVALHGAGQDLNDGSWNLPHWEAADLPNDAVATEYAGKILGLKALGEDSTQWLGSRNLPAELKARQQGSGDLGEGLITGHIWAMIALDVVQADYNRDKSVAWLLAQQKADGGFALSGSVGDTDVTGMALQALGNYKDQAPVNTAIQNAVTFIQGQQMNSAGFAYRGDENANTIATVISGLISVGENLEADKWQKNGHSIADALARFRLSNASYSYLLSPLETNDMATVQSLIAWGDIAENQSVWKRLGNMPSAATKTYHLRIEGSGATLLDKQRVSVEGATYALDVLQSALDTAGIHYAIATRNAVETVKTIGNDTEAKFGASDGWKYLVNGTVPNVEAGAYRVYAGDDIVFYYGEDAPLTLVPLVSITPKSPVVGEDLTVKVTADYRDPNTSQNQTVNVAAAKVLFNNEIFTTDPNGSVTIPSMKVPGNYTVEVHKDVPGSVPGIVRSEAIGISYGNSAPKKVTLRVEGSSQTVWDQDLSLVNVITALDVLEKVLTDNDISYQLQESAWGKYVKKIGEDTEGRFGGYDGWMYLVNGLSPDVGAASYKIKDGDSILFYYGMFAPETLIPDVSIHPVWSNSEESGIYIAITSTYVVDWVSGQKTTVKVAGAKVQYEQRDYITDAEGKVKLPFPNLPETKTFKVSKEVSGSYPAIVRTGNIAFNIPTQSNQIIQLTQPLSISLNNQISGAAVKAAVSKQVDKTEAVVPYINAGVQSAEGIIQMTIPQATKITSGLGWDGTLNLPKMKANHTVSVPYGLVNMVVEIGSASERLIFDKPVRLLFPGSAGKTVGLLQNNGSLSPITRVLAEDSYDAAVTIPEGEDAKIDVGADLVVWTKHFSTFTVYSPVQQAGNDGSHEGNEIYGTILFSVMGDAQKGAIYARNSVSLVAGDTAYSLLARQLGSKLQTRGTGQNAYVTGIDGLKEFDRGPLSGWMYKVNGEEPNVGAAKFALKNGDVLQWYYAVPDEEEKPVNVPADNAGNNGSTNRISGEAKPEGAVLLQSQTKEHNTESVTQKTAETADGNQKISFEIAGTIPAYKGLHDVKNHWSLAIVMDLVQRGITKGYEDGSIRPDALITRAEALVLLAKALGLEDAKSGSVVFSDEKEFPGWAKGKILAAFEKGIIKGYADGSFRPKQTVTRQEFLKMVIASFAYDVKASPLPFSDADQIAAWAKEDVRKAVALKWVQGYEDNTLRVLNQMTRAESFAILFHALKSRE